MISYNTLAPAFRLMLLTVGWRLSPADQQRCVDLIGEGVDWHRFLLLVQHHRVQSLVCASLKDLQQTRGGSVPEHLIAALQHQARANAFSAVLSTGETARVVKRFAQAGFPLTLLKGVGLSQQVYGDPSARQVGDIDLLSTTADLPRQLDLLGELGYSVTVPEARLTPRRLASLTYFWKDLTLHSPNHTFPIELHWRLFNNREHPANRLLGVAEFRTELISGLPLRVLAPIDQFLYQCAHGTADAWIYLKTLADVAGYLRLLTPEELDDALAKAAGIGLLDHVSAAIHLANDWLGTAVSNARLAPPHSALATSVRNRLETLLLARDFRPNRSDPSPSDWLRLELALVPGLRSKIEIARRTLNRPTLWSRIDLPDRLFWLYPLAGALLPPRSHTAKSDRPETPEADVIP